MKVTKTKSKKKQPWIGVCMHYKFKAKQPTSRMASLGVMDAEEFREKVLHNIYNIKAVKKALHQLGIAGEIDVYHLAPDGELFLETNYRGKETWNKIRDGDIFNERTGEPYEDMTEFSLRFAIPNDVLNKIPEDDKPAVTLFDRIKGLLWPTKS